METLLSCEALQAAWGWMLNSAMPEPTVQILHFKSDLSEVERANKSLRELWVRCALPEDLETPVVMCLEEILSNVIRHGCAPDRQCDVTVRYTILEGAEGGIEVEVSDNAKPFDPLLLPEPDLGVPLEQRKIGGLGVFLVRKMMDEVHYERRQGRNHFVFRKRWPAPLANEPN